MEIDRQADEESQKPHRRRSVIVAPDISFSPPGSRWGAFQISNSTLREIAKKSPTVTAIVNLRLNQLSSFARVPRHKGDRGFEIVRRDTPGEATRADEKAIRQITDFFLECGWHPGDPRRDDMAGWLKKICRDRYLLDAASTEVVYSRHGVPSELWAVDGATIEIQWAERYIPTTRLGKRLDQPVAYVQVVDGQVVAEYSADELIYAPANPITDLAQAGYGLSELEACIDIVAAEVLLIQYNSNYFDHGSVPPGILSIIGNFSEESLQELNVMWETDSKGVVGQHKPLAIAMDQGQEVRWLDLKHSNREMEMGDFSDKLRTAIASVFGADPVEIGQRTASNTGGVSASDNTEAKIDLSRDRGLVPAVDWLERMINRHIMTKIAPGFMLRFTGINAEDEEKKVAYLDRQIQAGIITLREARRAMGLEEVPPGAEDGDWLDAPLNPQALAVWMKARGVEPQAGGPSLAALSEAQRAQLGEGGGEKPEDVAKAWRPLVLSDAG